MKKIELQALLEKSSAAYDKERSRASKAEQKVRELERAIEQMREHWRPVPITHSWQPKNPQCALCDEPKDSPRHQADTP